MSESKDRFVYVKQSVSLRRDQVDAVKQIAEQDLHRKFSRVVQDAVDQLIERRAQEQAAKELVAA